MTAAIANETVQPSLSLFAVKGTLLATGDELILDKPTHAFSDVNVGAVYLQPAHTTYRTRYDAVQSRFYREAVHHHLIRYTSGPAEGLVDTVRESMLIEYVTADGLVGEL
ncbi:hypothetical protein [Nocardiopsis tropica]|uniref:Uncharacterized protein n=1 Tax=Nocardiopsis tropica TaxID=109330 RepID=A0ABU7KR70_9ACTN|nr:hypothetical protein [Nocardiopsis umidischolae]MEE2051788.1 hypothetical protein [Nocardiopsis umidischolae]